MPKNPRSGYLLFVFRFVACWLIAITVPVVDPFETEAGTRDFSREVYNLVMGTIPPQSFLFPKASPSPQQDPEDPADQVAVVLVDEETLYRYKLKTERTWPASARFYHQALLSIWRYKPRAVFVDMMFIDELPGPFAPFADIAKLYKQTGVPLLIMEPTSGQDRRPQQNFKTSNLPAVFAEAHKDDHSGPSTSLTPEIRALVKNETVEPVAAGALLDSGILRSYELFGLNAEDVQRKAAAVRLYELASGQSLDLSGPPLEIFWDLRVPETNALWLGCVKPGPIERLVIKWAKPLRPLVRAGQAVVGPGALKQTCGTVPTVPLAELFQPDTDTDAKRMIEGNLVLFGASVVGGDFYTVPVSDRLPGVYVHAMALENLLAFGGNYIRTKPKIGPFTIDERRVVWLFEAPLIVLLVLVFGRAGRNEEQQGDSAFWDTLLRVLVNSAKLGVLTCAFGFLLSTFLLSTLSLAPLNWTGMGALAALTNEILNGNWAKKIVARVLAAVQRPVEAAGEQAAPEAIRHPTADKEPI